MIIYSACCNALVISNGSYCICSHCFQVIPTILKNSRLSEEQASDYAKNEVANRGYSEFVTKARRVFIGNSC